MEGLSSICAGLGILEEDDNGNPVSYSKGEYCLDNLKDLLRFLRRDDPQTREVFKQVCKWNIVGKDLIPIIEYCQDDRNLVLNAVKVLVFLTMPVEPSSDDIPMQIEHLWGLKASVTFSHIVPAILSLLESPLENLECESFAEDDWKLVQLVLTFFRNILAIQDISTQQKAGGSATQFLSLRDRCLELLFQENVMDLILVLSQHVGGSFGYLRQDNLLLLEAFYYIFMGQDPELIAKAHLNNSEETDNATLSVNSLKCIMEEEERRKRARLHNPKCSPLFSGTFTRLTLGGSKTVFKGNPCSASGDALLKAHKSHRGPAKRMVWDHGRLPSTKNKLLKQLHDFIDQFLSGGYNVLMQSIHEDIDKEHQAVQNSDIVIFFKVGWFITSFQYHKFASLKPSVEAVNQTSINQQADSTLFAGSICGPLAESLNESMFLLVISRWRLAFDSLKETNDTKLLSAAGSLLKIMIRMLDLVLKQSPEESVEPKTARVLLYKLFYDQTEDGMTHFLFNMIKSFDMHKQTRSDLADLVDTIYVVIKLMEILQRRGTLMVSKRSRKKKMKKDRIDILVGNDGTNQNEVPGMANELSGDASTPAKDSLDLDSGGKESEETIQVEPVQLGVEMEELTKSKPSDLEKNISDDINGTDDYSGDDEQQVMTDEVDFKVSTLVSALGNFTIVKNLCWLLRFYKSNSLGTNHCIISMLRRISEDLELSPMLYQLSLLTTFYDILEEQKSRPSKDYENVVFFLTTLVRRMLRKMKSYPLLFVEILFWKTRKECHYINSECLLKELGGFRKEFSENQNDIANGETGLSGGQKWTRRSIADALGDDEADIVMSSVEVGNRFEEVKERSKLKSDDEAEINESSVDDKINGEENDSKGGQLTSKSPKCLKKKRKSSIVSTELEGKIKNLYEKYNNDEDCCHLIANALEKDGERISSTQLSRVLKKFGFKSSKKRTSEAASSYQFRDDDVTLLNMDKLQGISSARKPLHTRKRFRALSEDHEQKITDLFEQFKDQKKCSLMIANALDADGGVSAAQVSHKLKQLGLLVPQSKRRETKSQLRVGPDEVSGGGTAIASDDETLISLKKRKMKKHHPKAMDGSPRTKSNDQSTIGRELDEVDIQESERGTEKSAEVGAQEVDHAALGHADTAEIGANIDQSNTGLEENNQMMHDELADFDGDADVVEPQRSFVPRRQLRMILDLEDDE